MGDPEVHKLPRSPTAERGFLMAVFGNPPLRNEAGLLLKPSDFADLRHAAIWRYMLECPGLPDPVTFRAYLESRGDQAISSCGGEDYLLELVAPKPEETPIYDWGLQYAQQVKTLAVQRRAIEASCQISKAANEGKLEEVVAQAQQLIELVQDSQTDPEAKSFWRAGELLRAEFPEPRWIVPDLIAEGLSILAGRPKVGKSWLALQIAGAVGTGGMVLDRRVECGKVLFLALEDSPKRLKNRLQKQRTPAEADILFVTAWRTLDRGGLNDLEREIAGYRLAVIDTLSRALGRTDQLDPAEMSFYCGRLQHLAHETGCAVLVIDHHKKPSGLGHDPVDDVLGATAKTGAADTILGLRRQQGKRSVILQGLGRDVEPFELELSWDGLTCCWQLVGEAGQVRKDSFAAEVVQAIRDLTELGEAATTARIAAYTGKHKGNVSHALAELVRTGQVIKAPRTGKEQPYIVAEVVQPSQPSQPLQPIQPYNRFGADDGCMVVKDGCMNYNHNG